MVICINLEIIQLLQLETYEQLLKNDKKDKNKEILSQNGFISNPFLASLYSLILTIANKPEIILKSKSLLRNILNIISQITDIDNIAIYYKKKRLISVFYKILKELKNSKEHEDSLVQILKLVMYIFSKIGKKRPIYRDYMFKKALPEKISDICINLINKKYDFLKELAIYCFFNIRISNIL
jgi:hypothetical protein